MVWQCLHTDLMKTPHLLLRYYAWLVWNSMLGHVRLNFTIWWNGRTIRKLSFWHAHPGMPNVAGPEQWLWRIGYRWSYGDPCGSNALPGGDWGTQYMPYCGNQCPARLLISVLLYFLWVQCHEYTGGDGSVLEVLFNIRLDPNVFKLCNELKQCNDTACTNAYSTKDAHYRNKWTQTMK